MSRILVTIITGFLGSGKTTLLNSLLNHPEMAQSAVIVNEFGEIGLDYDLVERSDESVVQLENGCLCCSVKGDLIDTFRDLYIQRQGGQLPKFERVVIETTGIANPGPILQIILTDPMVSSCYELDGVVTTVDAINGHFSLSSFPECVRQVAVADRVVLTKTDMIKPDDQQNFDKTKQWISKINLTASVVESLSGSSDPGMLFGFGLKHPESKLAELESWLKIIESKQENEGDELALEKASREEAAAYYAKIGHAPTAEDEAAHDPNINTFCVVRDEPIDMETLRLFLEALTKEAGPNLLRVKGLLNIKQRPGHPAVIQGAQKIFHSLDWLEKWPSGDHRSRIVFITRGLDKAYIEETFELLERIVMRTQEAGRIGD